MGERGDDEAHDLVLCWHVTEFSNDSVDEHSQVIDEEEPRGVWSLEHQKHEVQEDQLEVLIFRRLQKIACNQTKQNKTKNPSFMILQSS